MASPRWRKVGADLWGNRTRTILVVLSIAVGVFAVGTTAGSRVVLTRDLRAAYWASAPSSAMIFTLEPFDENLVEVVRRLRAVRDAEGRRVLNVRIRTGPGQWKNLMLVAIRDYDDIRVNKVFPKGGAWPPPERQLLVERSSLGALGAKVGEALHVETPDGRQRPMRIAGTVHDLSQISSFFSGIAYGYITLDTLEWLGEPRAFNQMQFTVAEHPLDRKHVERVAGLVRDRIEKSGSPVLFTWVLDPGKHWADDAVRAMLMLLSALGVLSLLLSGFLVINTISSLLAQQVRQIGIMKAIGGRADQIAGMYLTTVLVYGALSLFVAVPLGVVGTRALSGFVARILNFDITGYSLPPGVLALEVAAGLVVPVLAALYPIIAGTRITVRKAITSYGLAEDRPGQGRLDRLVERVRWLSRPMLLSLRNTFRRKGRLALTLTTLTLAGAILVGVLSVRASLLGTLDELLRYWNYDVEIEFGRPYRPEQLNREALRIPGVVKAESWGFRSTNRLRPGGTESGNIFVLGVPAATQMLKPTLLRGRWLLPDDENAVVINTDLTKNEPDVTVGGEIILKMGTRETTWRVVGVVRGLLSGPIAFANYPYLARTIPEAARARQVQVVTEKHDAAFQTQVLRALEAHFRRVGLRMNATRTTTELRTLITASFNTMIVFLMIMAVLLAVVGALGLMGTMSINVLERTREIGVMRAMGASDGAVLRIVLAEGVVIGLMSWIIGVALAWPLGLAMSNAVGSAFLGGQPPAYLYSLSGAGLWLGVVIVLAAVASFLPAWNASRLTVRDVLAYE